MKEDSPFLQSFKLDWGTLENALLYPSIQQEEVLREMWIVLPYVLGVMKLTRTPALSIGELEDTIRFICTRLSELENELYGPKESSIASLLANAGIKG